MSATPDRHRALLQRALETIDQLQARLDATERAAREPIAIVGMGCRYPGEANTPEAFWRLLREGGDAIGEVPRDRWDVDAYYDPDPDAPGKSYTRWGGFLKELDQFDPAFFGNAPREANGMDPQHRLLLEVAWESLERAGQSPSRLAGSRTGVFVGVAAMDYAYLQMRHHEISDLDLYFGTGTAHSVAAGRLSYTLDLRGPSVAVDTACSSSLVAVHLACQSLRLRDCDMALGGGVNVVLCPDGYVATSRARMMSMTGRCHTFDASADGYVRAEGCGLVVLKRLSDAVANGDTILGRHPRYGTEPGRPEQRPDRTQPAGTGAGHPRRARRRRHRAARGELRRSARDRHHAWRSNRDAGARRGVRAGAPGSEAAVGWIGQDQHRPPRSGRGHCRPHQSGAGAPARHNPPAPALRTPQPVYRVGPVAGDGADAQRAVAKERHRAARGRGELVRFQRDERAPCSRRGARPPARCRHWTDPRAQRAGPVRPYGVRAARLGRGIRRASRNPRRQRLPRRLFHGRSRTRALRRAARHRRQVDFGSAAGARDLAVRPPHRRPLTRHVAPHGATRRGVPVHRAGVAVHRHGQAALRRRARIPPRDGPLQRSARPAVGAFAAGGHVSADRGRGRATGPDAVHATRVVRAGVRAQPVVDRVGRGAVRRHGAQRRRVRRGMPDGRDRARGRARADGRTRPPDAGASPGRNDDGGPGSGCTRARGDRRMRPSGVHCRLQWSDEHRDVRPPSGRGTRRGDT